MAEGLRVMRRTGRSSSNHQLRLTVDSYSVEQFYIVELSLGDSSGGGTPGPIPNPVVKPASADGTWLETAWESRSLPRDFSIPAGVVGRRAWRPASICKTVAGTTPIFPLTQTLMRS
jgi:hypothetical protein